MEMVGTMTLNVRVRDDILPPREGVNIATLMANELDDPRSATAYVTLLGLPPTGYPPAEPAAAPNWATIIVGGLGLAATALFVWRRNR